MAQNNCAESLTANPRIVKNQVEDFLIRADAAHQVAAVETALAAADRTVGPVAVAPVTSLVVPADVESDSVCPDPVFDHFPLASGYRSCCPPVWTPCDDCAQRCPLRTNPYKP
jgi:hypothetical protein